MSDASSSGPQEDAPASDPPLARVLGLPLLTCYGLGTILGAGIYALVGKVAGPAGGAAPLSFLVAAALAACSALSLAELAGRLPQAAAEAVYVEEAFGRRRLSLLVGLAVVVTGVVSAATIARGFVGYLHVFVPCPEPVAILGLVLLLGALASWGIAESTRAAAAITLVEVAGLLLVVWVGRGALGELPTRLPELVPDGLAGWWGVLLGGFLAFYAYIGFEDMVNVVEEVKEPARTLPRAILLALVGATALYLLVAVVCVLALPPAELAASAAPLARVYERSAGTDPTLISAIGLFAVANGALVQVVMGARVLYGLAKRTWLPAALGRVHPRTRTPLAATWLVTGVVLALALALPMETLAEVTSFVMLGVLGLVDVSLWRLKRRGPAPEGAFVVPLAVPVVGALVSLAALAFRLVALLGEVGS